MPMCGRRHRTKKDFSCPASGFSAEICRFCEMPSPLRHGIASNAFAGDRRSDFSVRKMRAARL